MLAYSSFGNGETSTHSFASFFFAASSTESRLLLNESPSISEAVRFSCPAHPRPRASQSRPAAHSYFLSNSLAIFPMLTCWSLSTAHWKTHWLRILTSSTSFPPGRTVRTYYLHILNSFTYRWIAIWLAGLNQVKEFASPRHPSLLLQNMKRIGIFSSMGHPVSHHC